MVTKIYDMLLPVVLLEGNMTVLVVVVVRDDVFVTIVAMVEVVVVDITVANKIEMKLVFSVKLQIFTNTIYIYNNIVYHKT